MKKLLYYLCLAIFILGICGGIFVILSELNIVTFILAAMMTVYTIILFRKKVKWLFTVFMKKYIINI